jgi:hypothetical protein
MPVVSQLLEAWCEYRRVHFRQHHPSGASAPRVTAEFVRSRLPEIASRATTTWSRDIRTGVRASKTG